MSIEIHLQSKYEEGKDVEIAQVLNITKETENREIIVMCSELRNILKWMENILYEDWEEGFENEK